MWKVCKRVMDLHLNAFDLHDSLHGCRDKRGTRTARIEAKLAQRLAHLEEVPFYRVFLDFKKMFDSIDRERCLLILDGYGVGPRMIRLIWNFGAMQYWSAKHRVTMGHLFVLGAA
jgi:hypothetical protein